MRVRAFVLVLATVSVSAAVSQTESELWRNPYLVTVTERELAFTGRDFEMNTSEAVYSMVRFNDGWVFMASLFDFRNVLFRKWGIYVVVTDPSGRAQWATLDMKDREVRFDTERLWVSDGVNTIQGGLSSSRIVFDFPGFSCDLSYRNILPPWKGGDGVEPLSPDGKAFAFRAEACPWGEVTGWITFHGRTVQVTGQGMLEKNIIVTPLNRMDPLLFAVRALSPEGTPEEERWSVGFLDPTRNAAYGSARYPHLGVARGKEWLFTTTGFTLEALDIRRSLGMPYPAPRRLTIRAEASGYLLEAEYRADTLFNVTDVLDEIPRWLRSIVSAFVRRPVYFRFLGELEGTVTFPDGRKEAIHLYGPYEYVVTR